MKGIVRMDIKNLIEQTNTLISAGDEAVNRFYRMREEDRSPDFYNEVKPYADHMQTVLQSWQQLANEYITLQRPKYVHTVQIHNAVDAMEQFFVQSFFKETSKKRFLQSVQSVKYTLETLQRAIEGGNVDVHETKNDC